MRRIQFTGPAYPDDMALFNRVRYYGSIGMYVGMYSGSDSGIGDYSGPWPVEVRYRTQVTADEFIRLWNQDHWGEAVISADSAVQDFVTKLKSYRKTFDVGAQQVIDGMTAVVNALDVTMTGPEAQKIGRGVPL